MRDDRFSLTRRHFGLSLGVSILTSPLGAETGGEPMPWMEPAVVKKAYVASLKPTWPRPSVDVAQSHAEVEAKLANLERRHPGLVRFTGGEILRRPAELEPWLRNLGDVDAILVTPLTSLTDVHAFQLGSSGFPTLLFMRPYTGFQYGAFSEHLQAGRKADMLATGDYGDLDVYARIFYAIHHMRKSKMLVVDSGSYYNSFGKQFSEQFGTTLAPIPYKDLNDVAEAVDSRKAEQAADRYIQGALKVVEPTRDEIRNSVRFYLGLKELMKREKANAITIECLGGFQRHDLKAYPCVAFSRLNDEGLYGVCQGDIQCAMTQLLMTAFSGKPGFVTNPVFDTSRNEVIYAHCVAPTSPQSIGGPSLPFILRSHMEDNKGVSVQVLMPVGGVVTVSKFVTAREFRVSSAEVLGNVDSPSGCRTQIRTRVADARKMAAGFTDRGIHRVVYYGDYRGPIEQMGRLMGFKVVHEM